MKQPTSAISKSPGAGLSCLSLKPLVFMLLAVLGALSLWSPHAMAQGGNVPADNPTYYYSSGMTYTLKPATQWVGAELKPGTNPDQVTAQLAGQPGVDPRGSVLAYKRRNTVLLPLNTQADGNARQDLADQLAQTAGVLRPVRVFQNGNNKYPIVETDEFLIQFKPNVNKAQATALLAHYGAVLDNPLGPYAPNGYLAHVIDPAHTAMAVANALYGKPQVLFSHPNLIWPMSPRFVPNDPLYPQQWHLKNTGQGGGTPGADIQIEKAWDVTRGDPNLTIAVIDTGIDVDHEDLQANMLPGFDAIERDGDPRPKDVFGSEDHGTVTAGLVGAVGNNGIGVTGVAPNCKILPIRVITYGQTEQDIADSFRFAADSGAAVINNSWGPSNLFYGFVPLPDVVKKAIDYAVNKGRGGLGCVVVFAAAEDALFPGGGNADLDGFASYDKVISVVASSNLDTHAAFSDSGQSTDIAAPGGGGTLGIISTDRMGADGYDGSNYTVGDEFEGTSASAPIVSGVAALILSVNPGLNYTQVRDILENTADKIDPSNANYDVNGHSASLGYGRVNAARAVGAAGVKLPVVRLIKPENNETVGGNVLLRATTDNDAAVRRIDFARRNEGGDASFSRTPSKSIPDRGTIVDSQPLSALGVVEQATVQVDITHTYPYDLVVTLIAPDGTATTLFNHNPTFFVITPTGIGVSINQNVPLQGKRIAGTWSLNVSDTYLDGELGTLDDWALTFVSPWVPIGSASRPVNGEWTAIWNTGTNTSTPPGVYAVRATAITNTANVEDIHHNVTVTPLGITLFAPADNETVSGKYLLRARTTNDATVQRVDFSRRKPPFSFSQLVNQQLVDGTTTSSSYVVTGHPGRVGEASVTVNIRHSYVGDLRITLVAPDGSRYVLQDQVGGNQQNLNTTYFNVPVAGKSLNGTWSLEVTDGQAIDFGSFISWGMTLAPEWIVVARDSDGVSNGEWNAVWNTDNTEPGVYDVRAVAISANGNAFDVNNNVTVAARIYNISGQVTDASGAGLANVIVTLTGNASGGAITPVSVLTNTQGQYTFTNVTPGTYTVTPSAKGQGFTPSSRMVIVGNASTTGINFRLGVPDRNAPLLTITNPGTSPNNVYTALTRILGTVSDTGGSGLDKVTALVYRYASGTNSPGYMTASGFSPTYNPTTNERPVSVDSEGNLVLPLTKLAAGKYYVRVTATDRAGNVTRTALLPFVIDTTAPTVTVKSPALAPNNKYAVGTLTKASGTATDDASGAGIAKVTGLLYRYASSTTPAGYWNGTDWSTTYDAATNELPVQGTTNWTFTFPTLSVGTYWFRATATDKAGNAGRSKVVAFVIKNGASDVAPTVVSKVALSSAKASVSTAAIQLFFTGGLDTTAADPAHYSVEVNGTRVVVQSASAGKNGLVTLALPAGSLSAGATVKVTWHDLTDSSGHALAAGTVNATAR